VFNNLGITFVDRAPVVPSHDDQPDTPHVIDDTLEDDDEKDKKDRNDYARELPVPNMEGYTFQHPATDTVFREMYEN
jgi:hypothetical protein